MVAWPEFSVPGEGQVIRENYIGSSIVLSFKDIHNLSSPPRNLLYWDELVPEDAFPTHVKVLRGDLATHPFRFVDGRVKVIDRKGRYFADMTIFDLHAVHSASPYCLVGWLSKEQIDFIQISCGSSDFKKILRRIASKKKNPKIDEFAGPAFIPRYAVSPKHSNNTSQPRVCSWCKKYCSEPFPNEVCPDCVILRKRRIASLEGKIRTVRELGAEGSHTEEEWQVVLEKYGRKCLRCGSTENLSRDHVISILHGGSHYIANIQPLCRRCNSWKGARSIDFRNDYLIQKHPEVLP